MLIELFKTEFGQKILLFLAPFFLSPHEFQGEMQQKSTITQHLQLSAFAPLLGAAFITGAIVAIFRTLLNKGISMTWILDYKSANIVFLQVALLTWIGYSAALSRYVTGKFLKRIIPSVRSDFQWPFAFWLSYYGGVLIVGGVFAWIIVAFLNLDLSYITGGISLIILIIFGFYLRLEIKLSQEKNRRSIHYIDWGTYNKLSLGIFLVYQILAILLIFFYYTKSSTPTSF